MTALLVARRVDVGTVDGTPAVTHVGGDRGTTSPRGTRIGLVASAVVLLATVVTAAVFHTVGGRWFVVRTPSMGTAAPVGTLVLTTPTAVNELHVGDIVAFHPPTEPGETFTHRVVDLSGGRAYTRGDINGARDPWALRTTDLVGRAGVVVPRLGWLLRALPLLLLGSLVVAGLTQLWVRPSRRGPARMVGGSLLFTVAAWQLRPFVGVVQLATATSPHGAARITAVGTGLLPARLSALPGHGRSTPVDLSAGQVREAVLRDAPRGGHLALGAHLHLGPAGWALLLLISATPLLWTVLVGYRRTDVVAAPVAGRHRAGRAQPVAG